MKQNTETPIFVDDRWRGAHGIGRYATEVSARLSLPVSRLGLKGDPSGPTDAFRLLNAPSKVRNSLLYNPGFNAFMGVRRQILTIHDLIHLHHVTPSNSKYRAYYAAIVRPTVRRSGTVLTVSETSKVAIKEWLRDDAVNVINAGNGCSSSFTVDGPATRRERPYVLFVGNDKPHKNLATIIRAMSLIDGIDLITVGLTHQSLMAAGGAASAPGRITPLLNVSDQELAKLYRGAEATLLPSIIEGFGLPALESIKCGTPVIHWVGCTSVVEICAGTGLAVQGVRDEGEWAEAICAAQYLPRVNSSAHSTRWSDVAGRVEAALRLHI